MNEQLTSLLHAVQCLQSFCCVYSIEQVCPKLFGNWFQWRAPNPDNSINHNISNNKSAQSNLGRGPRRCESVPRRRKVPIGYNGTPQIRPQKYPFPLTDPKPHYPPHHWTRPTYDALERHPDLIRRFPQCTGQTDAPTDRSFTGKFDDYKLLRSESDAA